MSARVSVVIPCYNSARFVGHAVRSALQQTVADLDVIVVNDGSTDDLAAALAPYLAQIRVIHQKNGGLSHARNTGIEASDSEYIAYLDADDAWHPEKIARQLSTFDADPDVDLVHTGVRYIGPDGALLEREKTFWFDPNEMSYANLLRHNIITVSSVLHRRSAIGAERFSVALRACEDWDLWLRLLADGRRFSFVRDPLTDYRVHGDNMSANPERMLVATQLVMERVAGDKRHRTEAVLARRLRAEAVRQMAHVEYERGNFGAARRLFARSAFGLTWSDLPRALRALVRPGSLR
jgi:glycosyltransferase involved in cell wall biosynthesis